jgi:lysophospholipase L1-like esterase
MINSFGKLLDWMDRHPVSLTLLSMILTVAGVFALEHALRPARITNPTEGPVLHRVVRLREHAPNKTISYTPTVEDIASSDGLESGTYTLRLDSKGYIIPSQIHENPDLKIVFLGGSTTECLTVPEDKRWPYLVGRIVEKNRGLKVNAYNSGVGGNNSLLALNLLTNKILELKPDMVVFMEAVNDLATLMHEGTYYNSHADRSLIHAISYDQTPRTFRDVFIGLRDLLIPTLAAKIQGFAQSHLRVAKAPDEWAATRNKSLFSDQASLVKQYRAGLRSLVAVARANDTAIVLMTQANRFETIPSQKIIAQLELGDQTGIDYKKFKQLYDSFNEIIRSVAAESGVPLIDLARIVPQNSQYMYDTVHYHKQGSERVSEIIASRLLPSLAPIAMKQPK